MQQSNKNIKGVICQGNHWASLCKNRGHNLDEEIVLMFLVSVQQKNLWLRHSFAWPKANQPRLQSNNTSAAL